MKLNTSIAPRRSGIVLASHGGQTYEFRPGADGELECEVADQSAVAALLATGNFYPAREEDFEAAVKLARSVGPLDDSQDDGDDDLDADPNAMPIEATTPTQPARKRAAGKRA
jgi:hypothetical protein